MEPNTSNDRSDTNSSFRTEKQAPWVLIVVIVIALALIIYFFAHGKVNTMPDTASSTVQDSSSLITTDTASTTLTATSSLEDESTNPDESVTSS